MTEKYKILAIDPGNRSTGIAHNAYGKIKLITVAVDTRDLRYRVRQIVQHIPPICFDWTIVEQPVVYPGRKRVATPDDAIVLGMLAGGVVSLVSTYDSMLVKPSTWKGGVPKRIHQQRIIQRHGPVGRASHDAIDALGLWYYAHDLLTARDKAKATTL